MAGFTLDASIYVVDNADFKKVVAAFVRTEMTRAIRAFLRACLARIPVRTGFLRGAFQGLVRKYDIRSTGTLDRLLNEAFLGGTAKRDEKDRKRLTKQKGFKGVDLSKGGKAKRTRAIKAELTRLREQHRASLGGGFSKVANKEYYYDGKRKVLKTPTSGIQFITAAEDVVSVSDNQASFNLDVGISYFGVNDFGSRGRGTPWNSMDAGAAAMLSSLEGATNRFPQISEILATFQINLRGTRLTTNKHKGNADSLISGRTLLLTGSDNG